MRLVAQRQLVGVDGDNAAALLGRGRGRREGRRVGVGRAVAVMDRSGVENKVRSEGHVTITMMVISP